MCGCMYDRNYFHRMQLMLYRCCCRIMWTVTYLRYVYGRTRSVIGIATDGRVLYTSLIHLMRLAPLIIQVPFSMLCLSSHALYTCTEWIHVWYKYPCLKLSRGLTFFLSIVPNVSFLISYGYLPNYYYTISYMLLIRFANNLVYLIP